MKSKPKILIVDDEEVVLDSCTQILRGGKYEIATATDGMTGLNLVHQFQPDLVFVDLKMPGISGFEVLEKIHDSDPNIVTVVITGYATISSAVDAMKKGAYDFLPKPFTPEEFRLITERGLDRRKLVLETINLRREKEMLRENFAAIVSHELKAPLGAVQQNVFVLADELAEKVNAEQKERFERIRTRIDDLVNLINTWLRVLSVDINKIREAFVPTSISKVIAKTAENIQVHATRKDIKINTTIRGSLKPVSGDEGTLTEALTNILGNAVKFSRTGNEVSIKAEEIEGQIMISITDQGVGISKEDMPYIFNDFYSGKSTSVAEKSSGIGLAITKRIIEAHDGTITAESELGKGSTFVICIPALKEN